MASPYLVDAVKSIDPVDALRLFVTDLLALADRLALQQRNRALKQSLDVTQERVFGPRTAIMLLGETAVVKRHFLKRLLGPHLNTIPTPVDGCLRLEHGAEAECTVSLPQGLTAVMPLEQLPDFLARHNGAMPPRAKQTIRLPNPVLARGIAVLDTPALDSPALDSPTLTDDTWLAAAAAESDCWIFVLEADHALSERSLSVLRQLPRPADQLDIVVEGAESLSGEARQAARDQLLRTLRERCSLNEARLTLLASPSAEGERGSFWNGRFATFQSVTLLRGREHWLRTTREVVAQALHAVGEEIDVQLHRDGQDMQQARLRLGMKDLDVLRIRFDELGLLMTAKPRQTPSLVSAVLWPEASSDSAHPGDDPAPRAAESAAHSSGADGKAGEEASIPAIAATETATETVVAPLQAAGALLLPPWRRGDAAEAAFQPYSRASAGERGRAALHATFLSPLRREMATLVSLHAGWMVALHHPIPRPTLYSRAVENLATALAPFFGPSAAARVERPARPRRRLSAIALVTAVVWLLLWALWPRATNHGPGAATQWTANPGGQSTSASGFADEDFEMPEFQTPVKQQAPVRPRHNGPRAWDHEVIADPSFTDLGLARPPAAAGPKAADRSKDVSPRDQASTAQPSAAAQPSLPLPSDLSATRARKQSRRGFLGLGKVWHWIRREDVPPQPGTDPQVKPNG